MVARPTNNLATGSVGSGGSTGQDVHDWLGQLNSFVGQMPAGRAQETLTIASGTITPTRARVRVDTEGGAATDVLSAIDTTNLPIGSIILLSSVDASRVVTLEHGTSGSGHIMLRDAADLPLVQQSMLVVLERTSADRCEEILRWYGSQIAAHRTFLGLGDAATKPLASVSEARAGTATGPVMTPARTKDALAAAGLVIGQHTLTSTPETAQEVLLRNAAGTGLLRATLGVLKTWVNKPDYDSGLLTIGTDQKNSTSHGLGASPRRVESLFQCVDAGGDGVFGEGDSLETYSLLPGGSAAPLSTGRNETQVWVGIPGGVRARTLDSTSLQTLTLSKWRWRVYAWK